MPICDVCGKDESLPYRCSRCGGTFCSEHRLPENHDCAGLSDWDDPAGVFDSSFDDSVNNQGGRGGGLLSSLTGAGGVLGYFRGNVSYLFLALMWLTFFSQLVLEQFLGFRSLSISAFYLTTSHPEYVWTWVTSIFAHGGFYHIVGNSIVLFFFGPLVERYVGSRKFAALFLVSGMLAGLAQIGSSLVLSPGIPSGVVGASGAIMAVLGVLTVLNPGLRIYLYFIIPVPLWLFTLGFAGISVFFFLSPGAGGGIAHFAHLIGLVIGLAYGQRVKGQRKVPSQLSLGGRGPGGPGGPGRF
ncbi:MULTISPECIES: rhomboid family intramembrane serine protease [Haloferax]|uniref:Rhomboid protease GlpG n=1 Tax=Haloferax massiliensis TaxID=1476858 RepID=A0A0D6JT60_9EURY|nr:MULTISPECIES: rhomboid family intramembrane serine protease [Haloferax]MDS0240668.1 rhomboid family intramembrane serine protease [Haloferax sp. S2CR25]MDS0443789.1 rhomboid family intramembrane serine protease [Haloferax sp. S2CR25-2]CQR50790.1 Rhomboid protease GlpG [Haloferax massiliensis]